MANVTFCSVFCSGHLLKDIEYCVIFLIKASRVLADPNFPFFLSVPPRLLDTVFENDLEKSRALFCKIETFLAILSHTVH